ncbi:hypothetical protein VTK73DRAFT_443 [Phialemonium thermophilum]|uniref:Zn(2)-C6 fungal-type domain-containing protein n=1 Tax=Phialemonium thermophilum TaxID=223376 RepID=A0ABR3XEI6_9PEZI
MGSRPEEPLEGTPAPYGRACSNCARSKCKCLYRGDGLDCARCHRLGKECIPSSPARKRNSKRRTAPKTAQLEQKLDDLVALLRSKNATGSERGIDALRNAGIDVPTPRHHTPSDASATNEVFKPCTFCHATVDKSVGTCVACGNITSRPGGVAAPRTPTSQAGSSDAPPNSSFVSDLEADERIRIFASDYLEFFPCVYLPSDLTSEKLRLEKPFLWYAIIMVTCPDGRKQAIMSEEFKKRVAQKLVVEHEKTMDTLLSLLVFLGWAHYQLAERPYLSLFYHLLCSLIIDFALNRRPEDPAGQGCHRSIYAFKPVARKVRTSEDRRAVLAWFLFGAQLSSTMTKLEILTWTPYMDECLDELSRNPEAPFDEVLVALVRIHLVLHQLTKPPWQYYHNEPGKKCAGPSDSFILTLRNRLDRIENELPHALKSREIVRTQLLFTRLKIVETALSRIPASPHNPDFHRHDLLSQCLDLHKAWFDTWMAIPLQKNPAVAFGVFFQLAISLISLHGLNVLEEPAWDAATAREKLPILPLCDRLVAQFQKVADSLRLASASSEHASLPGEPTSIFDKCVNGIRNMGTMWRAEFVSKGIPLQTLSMEDALGSAATRPAVPTTVVTLPPPTSQTGGVQDHFMDGEDAGLPPGFVDIPMVAAGDMFFTENSWLRDIFNVSWEPSQNAWS